MSDNVTKVSSMLPDAFYDIISYVVPSTFLLCGLFFSDVIEISDEAYEKVFESTSWVLEIILGLLLIGILYTIGVVLATISFYTSSYPIKLYLFIFKKSEFPRGFGGRVLQIKKEENRDLYLEMTKRYSRVMLLRSLVLVFFILMIVTAFNNNWYEATFYCGLTFVTLFAYYKRNKWLNHHFKIVEDILERKDNQIQN